MTELLGNLEELIADVRRRAEQRALAIEAAADHEARRIEAETEARVQAAREEAARTCAEAAEATRRERHAQADLEHRTRRLDARERRLNAVWTAAKEQLERLAATPAGDAALAAICRDAARRLRADVATVVLDPARHARFTAEDVAGWAAPGGPALELDPTPSSGGPGVLVRAGRATVDATIAERLAQARQQLRGEVEALLQGGAAGGAP
jgi:vacuolar-type H+-ATPase subunit E/Vma4